MAPSFASGHAVSSYTEENKVVPAKECALCNSNITDKNDSNEHLIPNAIGGRKKITGFICSNCNSKSGEFWDAELALK